MKPEDEEEIAEQLEIPGLAEWLAEHVPPPGTPAPPEAVAWLRRLRREQNQQ